MSSIRSPWELPFFHTGFETVTERSSSAGETLNRDSDSDREREAGETLMSDKDRELRRGNPNHRQWQGEDNENPNHRQWQRKAIFEISYIDR
jgi:hypothetical protein